MLRSPIYATVKRAFATEELRRLGFVADGSRMVKRGAHRREKAIATSLDGMRWRVTPLERYWR